MIKELTLTDVITGKTITVKPSVTDDSLCLYFNNTFFKIFRNYCKDLAKFIVSPNTTNPAFHQYHNFGQDTFMYLRNQITNSFAIRISSDFSGIYCWIDDEDCLKLGMYLISWHFNYTDSEGE